MREADAIAIFFQNKIPPGRSNNTSQKFLDF